jgi:long-chain acyl-CoA synthetase
MSDESKLWFNAWPAEVPQSINYPAIALQGLLQKTAKNYPEKVAIAYLDREITYAQLDLVSNQFAHALAKLQVKKGDRVALFLPNVPQFIIAYFGVLKAGAVVTAISPMHREREVEYQLNDSGAQTIVTLDSLYPIVEKVREKTKLKNVIVTGLNEYGSENANPTNIPNTLSFQQLIEKTAQDFPNVQLDPNEDLAALQYTGGTTGTAKGAMLTHANLVSNALMFAAWNILDSIAPVSHLWYDHQHDCAR